MRRRVLDAVDRVVRREAQLAGAPQPPESTAITVIEPTLTNGDTALVVATRTWLPVE